MRRKGTNGFVAEKKVVFTPHISLFLSFFLANTRLLQYPNRGRSDEGGIGKSGVKVRVYAHERGTLCVVDEVMRRITRNLEMNNGEREEYCRRDLRAECFEENKAC